MRAAGSPDRESLPQVLLVDDEPRILRSLKAALKNHYHIWTAKNGMDAKQIIQDNLNISVVVSDERMPGILGHELLAWSRDFRPELTRILMTGYSDMQAIEHSINEAEVFKYIAKPWNIVEVKEVIDHGIMLEAITKTVQVRQAAEQANDCQLAVMNRFEINDDIYTQVANSLGNRLFLAHDIGALLGILDRNQNIGVLFVDDDQVNDDTTNLVAMIHEMYPSIVIIVVTSAADGNSAIQLLNSGQIFKYLVKPLTETRLLPMLKAAISKFNNNHAKHDHIKQVLQDESNQSVIKSYWQKVTSLWH